MPLCCELSVVNANHRKGEISSLKCKRWTCDVCRPDNRKRVIHIAKRGYPNLFLTLTVSSKQYESAEDQAADLKRALVLFRRGIEAKWGISNIPFIAVFEAHKSGRPHLHLLLRGKFLEHSELLALWRRCIGSGGVNIQWCPKKKNVLMYIVKYIGKELHKFEGCKRWWRSQNYELEKEEKPEKVLLGDGYYITKGSLDYLRQRLLRDGFKVERVGEYKFTFESQRDFYQSQNYKPPWADDRMVRPSLKAMAGAQ